MNRKPFAFAVALVVATMAGAIAIPASAPGEDTSVRDRTEKYIAYNQSIKALTPEQRVVMERALSSLPAPCCSKYTALTCCCACNLSRTVWGLSKHLIVAQNYGAEQVRESVSKWIQAVNPDGFSGKVCETGGCGRPFHANGCGGMDSSKIAF